MFLSVVANYLNLNLLREKKRVELTESIVIAFILALLPAIQIGYLERYIERVKFVDTWSNFMEKKMLISEQISITGVFPDSIEWSNPYKFDFVTLNNDEETQTDEARLGLSRNVQSISRKLAKQHSPESETSGSVGASSELQELTGELRGLRSFSPMDKTSAAAPIIDFFAENFSVVKTAQDRKSDFISRAGGFEEGKDYYVSGGSVVYMKIDEGEEQIDGDSILELTVNSASHNKFNSIWYQCKDGGLSSRGVNGTSTVIIEIEPLCR